jgi:uncharacterized metal-binding protein YceD (DUF177 family)
LQAEKRKILGNQKEFIIPFVGLSLGYHEFTYEVNELFFENFEYSEIKKGQLKVDLSFEKQEIMLVLNFQLRGSVKVECDRCTDAFDHPLNGEERLIFQFGESYSEDSDEIITLPKNAYEINIAPFIYEFIHLLLPIQRIHPDNQDGNSGCNQKVINKLNEYAENNKTDTRWEVLKKLKENNNL